MRTAVLGAGAVGCYYGGMLARARREVVLIGRPRHVEAITRDGLYMDTLGFQEHVRVAASTEALKSSRAGNCGQGCVGKPVGAGNVAIGLAPA